MKKSKNHEYFHIQKAHLKEDRIFAFNLHVYHPVTKKYTLYLHGNGPLTKEKEEFLDYILSKGGELAVSVNQCKTFLRSMEYGADEIPSLKGNDSVGPLESQSLAYQSLLKEQKEELFPFKEVLSNVCENGDFTPLINRARLEIMTFSPRISQSVSTATFLAQHFLTIDNHLNRIVTLSYFMAKNMDMSDEKTLGDLICASFFAHIGQTQLDLFFSRNAQLKFSSVQKNKFEKHPGLGQHLIRKSKAELDDRVLKIIEDHHERSDGRGYPKGTMGANLDPLALILGAVSHILEYSSGRVTGQEVPLKTVLKNMKEKTFAAGLEFQFGDRIYENLINLLSTSTASAEAA